VIARAKKKKKQKQKIALTACFHFGVVDDGRGGSREFRGAFGSQVQEGENKLHFVSIIIFKGGGRGEEDRQG
jgi:hypothetical protein